MGYLPYDITIKTIFWGIVSLYMVLMGTLFLIKISNIKTKVRSQKALYRAVSVFFYFYAIARLFFIFSDYERDLKGTTILYYQYVAISYIFSHFGFLNIMYVGEKYLIKPGKFLIVYIAASVIMTDIIMVMFFPNLIAVLRYLNYGMVYSEVAIVILIFIYLFKETSGNLRKNAFFASLGLIIMTLGTILEIDALISAGIILPYYTPIIYAIGVTIYGTTILKSVEIEKIDELPNNFTKTIFFSKDMDIIAELQYLCVIMKHGITIYSVNLKGISEEEQEAIDALLGGAISAIEVLLKELSKSENPLKEIRQERFSILIENGHYVIVVLIVNQDHEILRRKMQKFLKSFEKEYEKFLREQITDTRLFEPVHELVTKIF